MALKYNSTGKTRNSPADTTLMRLAQKENFALFLLKGRSTNFFQSVLPSDIRMEIIRAQEKAIAYIKNTQEQRMLDANKGKK